MRGSLDANEARELIFGLQVGIASTERWFVPRRR
jgi:hypothetical protein